MRVRRFVGASAEEALRQVKAAFGSDALILARAERTDGSIELTAAVDAEALEAPKPAPADPPTVVGGPGTPTPTAAVASRRGESDVDGLLERLTQRFDRLERRLAATEPRGECLGQEGQELAVRLERVGMKPALAGRVAHRFEAELGEGSDFERALSASLGENLRLAPTGLPEDVTIFVGPTGAGKTTSIAKLAACLRGGAAPALVMADTRRVGAVEQLRAYARLLEVPMLEARDGSELESALGRLGDRRPVLVDTAGVTVTPADTAPLAELVSAAGPHASVALVLSAAMAPASMDRIWMRVESLAPTTCVLTHVDESGDIGAACEWINERGLRLEWLGTGQEVPGALSAVDGDVLAQWLLAA